MLHRSIPLILALLLGACSTVPEVDPSLAGQVTPAQVLNGVGSPPPDQHVVWTGTVQSVHNLRDRTRVEILSYPPSRQRQPLRERPSTGRFVVEMKGFLEPTELPVGRPVTASGRLAGVHVYRQGDVGRRLPLLIGDRLDAWPMPQADVRRRPDVRWGLGVGTGGSGVGVNIGL
jgi:starvation-inducible outer membrane lipoprotein